MEKLQQLIAASKYGLNISINPHKGVYQTIEEYLENPFKQDDVSYSDVMDMEMMGSLIEIQSYPDSPIGFQMIYHWNLEKAIDIAIEAIKAINPKEIIIK